VFATLDRSNLFVAETPQAFQYDLLMEAYRSGLTSNKDATDDAALVERLGFKVKLVISNGPNPKLTMATDMEYIKMILERESGERV